MLTDSNRFAYIWISHLGSPPASIHGSACIYWGVFHVAERADAVTRVNAGVGPAPVMSGAAAEKVASQPLTQPISLQHVSPQPESARSIVNDTALASLSVPRGLSTSDGREETAFILSTIVAQAVKANSQPQAAMAALISAGDTHQHDVYTVGQCDSLRSIALRFYGDAAGYNHIFEANRTLLSSPDKLRIGQRLVIPTI